MKTAIIYYSKHHGNTKKLIDAIAAQHDMTAIDATWLIFFQFKQKRKCICFINVL